MQKELLQLLENDNLKDESSSFEKKLELLSLLKSLSDENQNEEEYDLSQQEKDIKNLKQLSFEYTKEENIQEGDILIWKNGLKNKKRPYYNEPATVVEILKDPIYDKSKDSGDPYFNEELSLALALVIDERFVILHYDINRFKKLNK